MWEFLQDIPEWLGAAIVGIVFGLSGYGFRAWQDVQTQRRLRRARLVSRIEELDRLLSTGRELVVIQKGKRDELLSRLQKRLPDLCGSAVGYEAKFVACYAEMTREEKDLHGVIRAYSEFSIASINHQMALWLRDDQWFKTAAIDCPGSDDLAAKLQKLEIHLLLWQAKLAYWLPGQPSHALVYMADEAKHGLGFPTGTDESVKSMIQELRSLWKLETKLSQELGDSAPTDESVK